MIRDPSDGSVREKPSKEIGPQPNKNGPNMAETTSKEITSGLPILGDQREIERLSKSKEWLNNYHRKGQPT
jgi:hypothetical protein